MKKVRCDYKIWHAVLGWKCKFILKGFLMVSRHEYSSKASALRALKRLAAKLHIELGGEINE